MKMKNIVRLLLVFIIIVAMVSCDKEEDQNSEFAFSLETEFVSIRSCPEGSGLFIIKLNNANDQNENVNLQLTCDEKLNATLSKNHVSIDQSVFEVIIRPDLDISISDFIIMLTGERKGQRDSLKLTVNMFDWMNQSELVDIAYSKNTEFINWLNTNYPSMGIGNQTEWEIYLTYPQTLIVEHYTLLSAQYEMRFCCHVMVPPDDWSMIRLRERNTYTAFLAARQDSTDGTIYQIPVEEYPLLYGY